MAGFNISTNLVQHQAGILLLAAAGTVMGIAEAGHHGTVLVTFNFFTLKSACPLPSVKPDEYHTGTHVYSIAWPEYAVHVHQSA